MARVMHASEMGRAVSTDLQFQFPNCPQVSDCVVVIPIKEQGLYFEGSAEKQLIRGKASETFLPRLLEHLDGKNTFPQICDLLPEFPQKSIYDALALLYMRGLLFDGTADIEHKDDPYLQFIQRHIDHTRVNSSIRDCIHRLQEKTVCLYSDVSSDMNRKQLAELLALYPIPLRMCSELPELLLVDRPIAVYIQNEYTTRDELLSFGRFCYKYGVPWLLITIFKETMYLGPHFENHETLCVECFEQQWPIANIDDGSVNMSLGAMQMAMSSVAIDIVNWRSRLTSTSFLRGVQSFHTTTMEQGFIEMMKLPACNLCGCQSTVSSEQLLVARFEDHIAFSSAHHLNPKDHQNHYKPINLELATLSTSYPSALQINLDNCEEDSLLKKWSEVWRYMAGWKYKQINNRPKRWSPTGGNLGSVDLYIVINSIPNFKKGVYLYGSKNHVLECLGDDDMATQLLSCLPHDEQAYGYIIQVGLYGKVASKYHQFAYKIIHLDAGVAFTQGRYTAYHTGLKLDVASQWSNQEISGILHLDSLYEQPTIVSVMGGGYLEP
jgi:SagB-type dehydrogenase family enzyme